MVRTIACLLLFITVSARAASDDAIRDKGTLYLDFGRSLGGSYSLEYEKPIFKYASLMIGFEYGTYGVDLPIGTDSYLFVSFDSLKDGYKVKVVNNKIDFWLFFNMKDSKSKWHFGYPVGVGLANYNLKGDLTLTIDSLGALSGSYEASGLGFQALITLVDFRPVPHLSLSLGGKMFLARLTVPDNLPFTGGGNTVIKEVPAKFIGKHFFFPYPEVFFRLGYVF
jgi:hypothetical protein